MVQKRLAVAVVLAVVGAFLAGIAPSANAAFPGTNGLIVFADGTNPAIDVLFPGTGAGAQLCGPPVCFNNDRPTTSPDGKTVVFVDSTSGSGGLWTIPITGGTPVHIPGTSGPFDFSPSFTADGSTIVFTDAGILSRIPVAGGTETPIAGAPNSGSIREAEVSPNGLTIAYIDDCSGVGCVADLETIPVAGGTPHVVLTSTGNNEDQVSWSPDGTKIALIDFADCLTTPLAIVSATATSGVPAPTCLGNSLPSDFDPSFSPDGTQIAVGDFSGASGHISVLGANGAGRTPFAAATTSGENYYSPGPPACTQVTSTPGQLYVAAGQFVCASNGTIGGNVNVASGGSLSLTNETVNGSVSSSGAKTMTICGSRISGAVTIANSTGAVEVGDGGDDSPPCAGNTLSSNATISGNTMNAELGGNRITGTVNFYNNRGTAGTENSPEIESNTIGGNLNCSGNTSLSNDNLRNTVSGARTGAPCSSSTF
jgi:hypothetical protein